MTKVSKGYGDKKNLQQAPHAEVLSLWQYAAFTLQILKELLALNLLFQMVRVIY